ncbi:MAG: COP23 domain-containing protein [Oscillatoria sp. PMC 1068.18]|nr:COP23 domain-containing protein [Oscillatoria sp. PMC 1076.18]MEC4987880.1 COP23 domain-containing protein [Oscillatoria sp. PMC 1068.18]
MKFPLLAKIVTAGAIAAGSIAIASSPTRSQPAPGQSGFYCDTSSGVPITMYQNRQGNLEPWIRWSSNFGERVGYNPQQRCTEVSNRLESYRVNKQLRYITAGTMNGQPVICTAQYENGACTGLIYTLKPGQNAIATLNQFIAWRTGVAGTPSLSESPKIPYIDVSGRIESDSNNLTTPVTPQQTPGTSNEGDRREL